MDAGTIVPLRLEDELLYDWLLLYETAFPAYERMLIGDILRIVQAQRGPTAIAMKGTETAQALMLVSAQGKFQGLAMYRLIPRLDAAHGLYFAIQPELRNQGLGSAFYQEIVQRVWAMHRLLVYEVESPAEARDSEEARLCQQRIELYRRHGAQQLLGVSYQQTVGEHCSPIPMQLMVHLREPLSVDEVYSTLVDIFGAALQQVAPLVLV